ncbi:MAG TPA: hypothetical protein PK514_14930 [Spirochaetota bacterium]|nr:hypothetical protein [Spirochaetota bacterium]
MPDTQTNDDSRDYSGIFGGIKKSIHKHGFVRWLLILPVLFMYSVSYSLLPSPHKTPFQVDYEDLNKRIAVEKKGITTPLTLPSDLFYYSSFWQEMAGENPLVHTLVAESMEYMYKTMNFLKDIQDNDEAELKKMVHDRLSRTGNPEIDTGTEEIIYKSINNKGEYFSRLFEQLFTQHGLKKLGEKYTETDVEVFFNMLCVHPEGKKFRRLLGAMVLNVPYYLVIKNSVNEYYQNSDILIPVDLFSFTLFMMYLDGIKNKNTRPTIEECRRWVFSVIVPDEKKRSELQSGKFSVQPVIREEMIMPNPGYFSKAYNKKKHKAIDIASERGTMIRSPVTGTVTYYEKGRKKSVTGNFIIIKDENSHFNIFICHMDNKDYIEGHSTEGELAAPIANLTPNWVHPLKKGQFFQVVGNTGKSTGAHTHIQIAQRTRPYTTFNFFSVNEPYQKQFNEYLYKNSYWHVYSRTEQLLLSVFGMVVSQYDSTRHFADRDPEMLELYKQLQKNYTPVSVTVDTTDLAFEELPEKIIKTYFSSIIQEQIINERYKVQLKYYGTLAFYLNYLLKMQVPLAPALPGNATPLTPWMLFTRRKDDDDEAGPGGGSHDRLFYEALNKYFLYRIMQLNNTPRDIRDQLLSDPLFTGNIQSGLTPFLPEYTPAGAEERINRLGEYVREITDLTVDLTFISDNDFCESIFNDITAACKREGIPLDSNFGFFRYHMSELQNSYQTSRFISFPDTREFKYDKKYDPAIRSFFLDIFELAAEHKNYDLFRAVYFRPEELSVSILRKAARKVSRGCKTFSAAFRYKLFHTPYPVKEKIFPEHLHSVFQEIIKNIIKPVSFESRTYAETTFYRAAETSLFYSLIYEVYLTSRERYMKLFPEEQLAGVIEAIGLFDSMFKVFCDNSAQKQLIDNEHSRITLELEVMEKELHALKNSKKDLQEDFRNKTASLKTPDDYIGRHSELFSNYITEEEKISGTIAYLEQSLARYRDECGILKNEKEQLQMQYEEKLKKISRNIEDLKSKNILDQQRFSSEIKRITYDKGKSDLEIIDLKAKIEHLKNEIERISAAYSANIQKAGNASGDLQKLQKRYEKTYSDLNIIQKQFDDLVNVLRNSIGPYTKDLSMEELTVEVQNILKSVELYRNASVTINLLQEQQKSDKRSLALNADLITRLRDRVEKLEVQLEYLRDTKSSDREKDLEEENKRLSEMIKKK